MRFKLPLIIAASMAVIGCDPGLPEGSNDFTAGGSAAALSDAEMNRLPPEEQYMVANKLLGTIYRGVSVQDFYTMDAGMNNLQPKSNSFLADTRAALTTNMSNDEVLAYDTIIDGLDAEGNPDPSMAKYSFDTRSDLESNRRAKQLPLARIKEYPLSRDMFVHWMAYVLINTIMFSPAEEMESTDYTDIQNMFRFLVTSLDEGKSIRQIIRSNLPSLARWRVSRSPENHALEAYELYLGLFETEEDSYRGGIACKDLYLTSEADGYLIRRTDYPNTEPQLILGSEYITTCDDLYDVIAGHPLIIPRVTEAIFNYFVEVSPDNLDYRERMINSIVASGPETFEDIFTAIIFSREYLLNIERPRSFEENLMPLLDTLKWDPATNAGDMDNELFRRMTEYDSQMRLGNMGWDTMTYKIGRIPAVPLDGLSFANYHKALRERLLRNNCAYRGGCNAGGDGLFLDADGVVLPVVEQMSAAQYIDYLFMSVLFRKATATERTDLLALYGPAPGLNHTEDVDGVIMVRSGRHDEIATITFDYISRLPEQYYFRAVN